MSCLLLNVYKFNNLNKIWNIYVNKDNVLIVNVIFYL